MPWNKITGEYEIPASSMSAIDSEDRPENWVSKPGGEYFLGMSFHFAPYNHPEGSGIIDDHFLYSPAPYLFKTTQDQYNSWYVSACLKSHQRWQEHWEWLPGILIIDTSTKYTLPDASLSGWAGCEYTDHEPRVFYGVSDLKAHWELVRKFLELVNRLTGPGWANWPFGNRQLAHALTVWVAPGSDLPEVVLLTAVGQHGVKHTSLSSNFYHPGNRLGVWEYAPKCWDCRKALSFLCQAKLMLDDGLIEIAVSTAIAAIENASAEIIKFLLHDDFEQAQKEIKRHTFLSRFDQVLPNYGISLPHEMFADLKQAYLARNSVVHGLAQVNPENATIHLKSIENALLWYWQELGGEPSKLDADIPF